MPLPLPDTLILDGALATELERRGARLDDPLWSAKVLMEQPELIRQVHLDYFRAGADVATTASYQATFEGFARRGLDAAGAAALMQRAVMLALEARDAFWAEPSNRIGRDKPLVAASIGPYGAMLADGSEYRGGYGLTEAQLMDFHRPRMAALLAAGPDLLAVETVPCAVEAVAVARLLGEFDGAQAWIAFSCRDGAHGSEGEPIEACIDSLEPFGCVRAVGVNCTAPEHVAELVGRIRARTRRTVVVYPNSGERYDAERKCWHGDADGMPFAEAARAWRERGAGWIGGCCRTTPEDIAALARWRRPAS